MAGQAAGTAVGRRRGTAGLATGVFALLFAVAGCSSTGTAAAPSVRPTAPATATSTASSSPTVPVPPVPQPTSPGVVPSASAAGTPSEPAAADAVIYGCEGKPLTAPTSFSLACSKGAALLSGLVWTGWGGLSPTATGRLWEGNAAGGLAAPAATVTLGGLSGGEYTTLRINAPKAERPNLEFTLGRSGPAAKG
ncbi:hypothetical protein [Kitasatospora sp. NPDC050463]|uniref:hypothetical protein n=1 Tax=Kitasatospora sp. NPDC050463 TaxID=3155786 RepID=UPI0033D61050